MKPWERQSGETSAAFHAFEHYRDLSSYERSVRVAYNLHHKNCLKRKQSAKRASGEWVAFATNHDWIQRAAQHDSDLSPRTPGQTRQAARKSAG